MKTTGPKLLPKLLVFVRVPRKYLLRRVFSIVLLKPKELKKLKAKLKQVEGAITYLRHLASVIEKILERQ